MRRLFLVLLALPFFVLGLVAWLCPVPNPISLEAAERLQPGMSRGQVYAILGGAPYSARTRDGGTLGVRREIIAVRGQQFMPPGATVCLQTVELWEGNNINIDCTFTFGSLSNVGVTPIIQPDDQWVLLRWRLDWLRERLSK